MSVWSRSSLKEEWQVLLESRSKESNICNSLASFEFVDHFAMIIEISFL